jgi:parallel beta-helix repeat protein
MAGEGKRHCACAAAALLACLAALGSADHASPAVRDRIVVDHPAPNALQEAIDAAAPGAKIRIRKGHYREALVLEKPLRLVGVGRGRPTIDAECQVPDTISVTSPGVALRGLRVVGAGPHAEVDFSGVPSGRAQDLRLRDTCDTEYGINVFASGALTLSGNAATGFSDAGIYIGEITNTFGGALVARGNDSFANNKGLIVEFSAGGDVRLEDNDVHDNALPGEGEPVGIFVNGSDGVQITGNRVRRNGSVGVWLTAGADGNVLTANHITDNPTDLRDEGAGNCGSGNVLATGGPLASC